MLKGKKITIIGGGKMGSIIAQGLIDRKIFPAKDIVITDIDAQVHFNFLRSSHETKSFSNNEIAVYGADIIIIAVKPQNMAATLQRN